MKISYCTIITADYLHYALTLYHSVSRYRSDAVFNVFIVFFLDRVTKKLAVLDLKYHKAVEILHIFIYKLKLGINLFLTYNKGTAFSIIKIATGNTKILLIICSIVITLILLFWLYKENAANKLEITAISFILGGALGNIYDRLVYGYVVDFIDIYANKNHWPVFNLADMAISLGVILLLYKLLFVRK